ncbi:Lrp/AsnC family transcriptional regulator [Ruegeria litorea]|uniref:Lrp/AsnC family transcriptional regulator n=1 Tax=Falsiruegeria litorea TaxID=1280831 RepID=A0ABS5WNN6_9RHOB|nr:Lrp/AsnC family transcriptional regulator [Falsiruegeria litorea]MBT3139495.1 Lrp/AsnC family transcriptional regulator [Falsiruegeria litorea]
MRKLDQLDKKILRTLQKNGRISNKELAETVGLSATPCWQRVRKLEEDGFIGRCVAMLDAEKVGAPDIVLVELSLEHNDEDVRSAFEKAVHRIPNILEAHTITGDFDYILKVAVSGTRGYQRFLTERLYKIPGVQHTRASFSLKCSKRVQAYVPD